MTTHTEETISSVPAAQEAHGSTSLLFYDTNGEVCGYLVKGHLLVLVPMG
jgi:hypothetical protein